MENSTIKNVTDEVTKKLHDCISKVKISPEARMEYMKWDAMIFYERRDAKNEGKIEGRIEGRIEGKIEGKKEVILDCLSELGPIPEELREQIEKETDLGQINKWIKAAINAVSVEEFIEKM